MKPATLVIIYRKQQQKQKSASAIFSNYNHLGFSLFACLIE